MAIEDSREREALKAIGSNNDVILHLFTKTLQGYGAPSYTGQLSQRRWSINGYGRAAATPAGGAEGVFLCGLRGGATMELA